MSYVLDKHGSPIIDQNGDKIEFSILYQQTPDWYKHKEPLHINDDGHLDTEDRHLVIKDAISQNHAVSKNQLDQLNNNIYSKLEIDIKLLALQNSLTTAVNSLKSQISELRNLNFRNDKINNRLPQILIIINNIMC